MKCPATPILFGTTRAALSNVATRLHLVGLGAAFDQLKTCRHRGEKLRLSRQEGRDRRSSTRGHEFLTCGIRTGETDKLKTCRHRGAAHPAPNRTMSGLIPRLPQAARPSWAECFAETSPDTFFRADSLAGASGLHGREAGTDTQSEPQAPPSQPPERRRRGAAEASGAGPSRPGARTPRVPSLTPRACMKRGPRRTRLPHPHPHRQHHERSARRELHEGIGLGSQTFERRHTGHPGQQRRPQESLAGEARA